LRRLAAILAAGLLAYLALAGLIYAFQRSMIFLPDRTRVPPEAAGLPQMREIALTTSDGVRIIAWEAPAADEARPVVLYLHGNGGSLPLRSDRFAAMLRDGFGVLAVSWRGYGGSDGAPSEEGLGADADAAMDWLAREGVPPERIVLFGESLGSSVALRTAARRPVRALILDSPYESIAAIAAARFFWLPVDLMLRDPFRAIDHAPRIRAPVLAFACTGDWVTPYAGSLRLMAALSGQKLLIRIERACHIPAFADGGREVLGFLRSGSLEPSPLRSAR
jgi:hypothetical protein